MAAHIWKFGSADLEVEARGPRLERQGPRREHSHRVDFGAVAVGVEVGELVAKGGKDAAFPRVNLVAKGGEYAGR